MTYKINPKALTRLNIIKYDTDKDGRVRALVQSGKFRVWHTIIK